MTVETVATQNVPLWISDDEIEPSWIHQVIPELNDVIRCTVQDISNQTKRSDKAKNGATLLLHLTFGNGEATTTAPKKKTLVMKQVGSSSLQLSSQLGLAREALFYNQLASKVKFEGTKEDATDSIEHGALCIPQVYYAFGDMKEGSKCVIMEDLTTGYIDSGILFGPGNPNNWKRDLPAKIAESYPQP